MEINNNNPFGVLYHRRGKADKYSEFLDTSNRLFQGKKLAPCKGLTAWVRWGNYLFRWYEVFWYLGCKEVSKFEHLTTNKLQEIAIKYIGKQPMLRLLKKISAWQIKNKDSYFYARCQKLSRAEMERS